MVKNNLDKVVPILSDMTPPRIDPIAPDIPIIENETMPAMNNNLLPE